MQRLLAAICGIFLLLAMVAGGTVTTATENEATKTPTPKTQTGDPPRSGEATKTATPRPSTGDPAKTATPKSGDDRGNDPGRGEFPLPPVGTVGPMEIRSVDPSVGNTNRDIVIEINGRWLRPSAKLYLDMNGTLTELKNVHWDNFNKMFGVVPAGIALGAYDVLAIQVNDNLLARLPNGYTAVNDGPRVLDVDPRAGLNTEPNLIRVEGYNFAENAIVSLGGTVLDRPSKPGDGPRTANDSRDDGDNEHAGNTHEGGDQPVGRPALPSQIYAIVPSGFTPGLYDVSVTNPARTGVVSATSTLTQAYAVLSPDSLDLSVNEDSISFDPPSGRVGDTVDLMATIARRGGAMGPIDVQVQFAIGDPLKGGTIISTTTVSQIMSNTTQLAKVPFNTTGLTGAVPIVVTVDPNNQYPQDFIKRNNVATRRFKLLPNGEFDIARPVITSFTINGGASSTPTQTVQLNISASDQGTGLNSMFIVERRFSSSAREWGFDSRSGWIPYTSQLSYTLSSGAGTRVLQVWVSDSAGNISKPAHAQIDLIPPVASINKGQVQVFKRDLAAGDTISVTLTTISGDADLLLFGPRHKLVAASGNYSTTLDAISYTAAVSGTYLLEVEGSQASTYSLSIAVTKGSGTTSVTSDPASLVVGKTPRDTPTVGIGDDDPTDAYALPLDDRGPNNATINLPAVRVQ